MIKRRREEMQLKALERRVLSRTEQFGRSQSRKIIKLKRPK